VIYIAPVSEENHGAKPLMPKIH